MRPWAIAALLTTGLLQPGAAAGAEPPAPDPSAAFAASPAASSSSAGSVQPRLSKFQQRVLNLAKLDLQMTKSLTDTQANRDRLLAIYEKLAELQCMGELEQSLRYDGPPNNAECREYLEALRELQPANPVLVCAEYGIDSDLCAQAYDQQYISTETAADGAVEVVDLEAKLSALEDEGKRTELAGQFEGAAAACRRSKTPEDCGRALDLARRVLTLACRITRIVIVHAAPSGTRTAAEISATPAPSGDPLRDLVSQYGDSARRLNPTPKPAATPPPARPDDGPAPFQVNAPSKPHREPGAPVWRVRYLTYDCMEQIEAALVLDPRFAPALCYEQGFTSPRCIAARRRERRLTEDAAEQARRKKMGVDQKSEGGLGTF